MAWSWNWRRPVRTCREHNMVQELLNENDRWVWKFNERSEFYVSNLRHLIDRACLPVDDKVKTKWNSLVPKKVNLFIWRLRRDNILTFINLFAKGIDVDSFRCPQCETGVEYLDHIFQQCKFFVDTRRLLSSWLHLEIPVASPDDTLKWCDNVKLPTKTRHRLEAIIFTWWWYTWKARNNKLYNNVQESNMDIFNATVSVGFVWIVNRDRKDKM